jgi:hypothetical protein
MKHQPIVEPQIKVNPEYNPLKQQAIQADLLLPLKEMDLVKRFVLKDLEIRPSKKVIGMLSTLFRKKM